MNIYPIFSENQTFFSIYDRSTQKWIEVKEIVSDIAYRNIPLAKLQQGLKAVVPHLVQLSDGTHKLYLRLGLQGGMMDEQTYDLAENLSLMDPSVPDKIVADKILKVVPCNSYSRVSVRRVNHRFSGEDHQKASRLIRVTPSNWKWFVNLIRVLSKEQKNMNEDRVVQAILGSGDEDDVKQLIIAFERNYCFEIMISFDGLNFEFETKESSLTLSAQNRCVIC